MDHGKAPESYLVHGFLPKVDSRLVRGGENSIADEIRALFGLLRDRLRRARSVEREMRPPARTQSWLESCAVPPTMRDLQAYSACSYWRWRRSQGPTRDRQPQSVSAKINVSR